MHGGFIYTLNNMKKLKIVNKKVFSVFILVALFLVGIFIFSIFKIKQFNYDKVRGDITRMADSSGGKSTPEKQLNFSQDIVSEKTSQTKTYVEYNNKQYLYTITFPSDWYINSDSAEAKLEESNIGKIKVSAGGQTFWSNYKNINDFSPEQRPEDFHLLGLTIYENIGNNIDDLAKILGFNDQEILQKNDFIGKSVSGIEYVALGESEENPQVVIIFQKEKRFFIFNLGFINGDADVAKTMEDIARTIIFN